MRFPDWTHFRSDGTDPCGPCCLLESAFPLNELPRNYIWTLGFVGEFPDHPEAAEISAQVKSYSREWLMQRQRDLELKRKEAEAKRLELKRLQQNRKQELDEMTRRSLAHYDGMDSIKRQIEASPLGMASSLAKSAMDLATGGTTDPTARMEICKQCPFMGDDKRCGKCGCFLPAKTRVKKSKCPIGLW